MAKKQTRRSISFSRKAYDAIKKHCHDRDISMASFVEAAALDAVDRDEKLGTDVARNRAA